MTKVMTANSSNQSEIDETSAHQLITPFHRDDDAILKKMKKNAGFKD
jgi:hypothetical protein